MKPLGILLALLAACMLAEARPVHWWTPKELCDKADFVIIGTPVSIEKVGEDTIRLGETTPMLPTAGYLARIRVNHLIYAKTNEPLPNQADPARATPDNIEFRYSNLDFTRIQAIANGPFRIYLEKDVMYIIYLKKDPKHEGGYVGALDGEFDDGQAVIRVIPPETKPAPPTVGPAEVKPE